MSEDIWEKDLLGQSDKSEEDVRKIELEKREKSRGSEPEDKSKTKES